jgi:ribosomal protein L7Ae-like RNA K-turn-binding protein
MDKQIQSLLSISMKAGKIVTGGFSCERSLANGQAKLVLLATDASDNTKKKFIQKTFYYQIPMFMVGSKAELSHCVGKRDSAVYAVTDVGLAANLVRRLQVSIPIVNPQSMEAGECQK